MWPYCRMEIEILSDLSLAPAGWAILVGFSGLILTSAVTSIGVLVAVAVFRLATMVGVSVEAGIYAGNLLPRSGAVHCRSHTWGCTGVHR